MTAYAVIGALYGDEGKGLVTDYLADQIGPSALVVRSNGGAQAAHTVQTPDGRRHVFHHFGSGSFVGARTHLSKFMILNPIAFNEEWDALEKLGVTPQVTIDPNAMVTTPFDMLINQAIETLRSTNNARHGSCGLGIGETVERDEYSPDYRIRAKNLVFRAKLAQNLGDIRDQWVGRRWNFLAKEAMPAFYAQLLNDDSVIENYLNEVALFLSRVDFIDDYIQIGVAEDVIFEGAQGLLLDEHFGEMPYCTRSSTGMRNVAQLCQEAGITEILTHYVMRAYTTRHGAGPMAHECKPEDINVVFDDPTNVHNDWQGTIRVGQLDVRALQVLTKDIIISIADNGVNVTPVLVMTCMDQVHGRQFFMNFDNFHTGDGLAAFAFEFAAKFLVSSLTMLTSWGPTRSTMRRHVVEAYRCDAVTETERLSNICMLNDIRHSIVISDTLRPELVGIFDTEEARQLVRLTATKQLTNPVPAL